jgi:predicted RNase H-like HicB family nuclease
VSESKPFPYRILVEWSPDDDAYVARLPSFDGVAAHGDTAPDAVREVIVAGQGMIATYRYRGRELPPGP